MPSNLGSQGIQGKSGIFLFNQSIETYINPVFLMHKRVTRAIAFELFTSPSTSQFSDLKILKLHNVFQLKLFSFVYDCVNKISPLCFHAVFNLVESVHEHGTWQATKMIFS